MAKEYDNEFDVLVVGAGFSGLQMLNKLRKQGFNVKIFERSSDMGGTWHQNCYPGARVDSCIPIYQFTHDKLWMDFEWTERFPGRDEICEYFRYVDNKLNLSKDIQYNTCVNSAKFDHTRNQWLVKSSIEGATEVTAVSHLILCTGILSCKYTPKIRGLEKFKGESFHANNWPQDGSVNLKGKRVAIIGTGATGVQVCSFVLKEFQEVPYNVRRTIPKSENVWPLEIQKVEGSESESDVSSFQFTYQLRNSSGQTVRLLKVIQEIGPYIGHLTVYQRTPNLALPMQQSWINDQTNWKFPEKDEYEKIFNYILTTFGAMNIDSVKVNALDVTPEERRAFYEHLYRLGSFHFLIGSYQDILFSKEANDTAYEFWCEKTRARVNDPIKQEILAPKIPPHPLGAKRPSLEQRYYEVYNQSNVDIINIRESPILEVTENGVRTEKEGVVDVEVLILATGFNGVSGSILDIEITNEKGESLQEKWNKGIRTHLGLATNGFSNLFFINGPQGPAALINGPSLTEIQGDWLLELMLKIRKEQWGRVDVTKTAEEKWRQVVFDAWNITIFAGTDSWYEGCNIPGKIREPESYAGGCTSYIAALSDCAQKNYEGFDFA